MMTIGKIDEEVTLLIPVYNEEITISNTIKEFRKLYPKMRIVIIDNCSTDKTSDILRDLAAQDKFLNLRFEGKKGKGNAIRLGFKSVMTKYVAMVDGDLTYSADDLQLLHRQISLLNSHMVVGNRHANKIYELQNDRNFHVVGNAAIQKVINFLYKQELNDILSGFRIMSSDFYRNYPLTITGFELETDITLFALRHNFTVSEIPIGYKARPNGSFSKLSTYKDGLKILAKIIAVFSQHSPFKFYSFLSVGFYMAALITGSIPLQDYLNYHYVYHVPLSILSASFIIIGTILFVLALILTSINEHYIRTFEQIRNWQTGMQSYE